MAVPGKPVEHPALTGARPPAPVKATPSAVGNLADLAEGQVLLPEFVAMRDGHVWINPEVLVNPEALVMFVNRVYMAGACLVDVNVDALCELMYPRTAAGGTPPPRPTTPLAIAREIRPIPPERQALYKNIKITDGGSIAEYVFEPPFIERIIEKPVYGMPDENGDIPVVSTDTETVSEPTKLDFDEFVAMMWQKGLCVGLDLQAIRSAMAASGVQRVEIAKRVEPVDGEDATLVEQTQALHRDDSPRLLPNGKIDLKQFTNRFPQISAGEKLLKKVPRKFGQLGFEFTGHSIEPPVPRDYTLEEIAGPGTIVERNAHGEFIISVRDGFLNIDTESGLISVSEKIINREGVSARTTGDLSLAGDEFEEHGEVQEKRAVEGKHMTFFSDVFGTINSSSGRVTLKSNLAGGQIHDNGGEVKIEGRASQAIIEVRGGSVEINYAEGCTIVANRVTIQRAQSCAIVAEEVTIVESIACAIAARNVLLERAGDKRDVETLVTMAIPDYSRLDKRMADISAGILEIEGRRAVRQAAADTLAGSDELKSYLNIQTRVRSGGMKLSPQQEDQLKQLAQRLARPLQQLRVLHAEIQKLNAEIAAEQEDLVELQKERSSAAAGVQCEIKAIVGLTAVRTMAVTPGAAIHSADSLSDLNFLLRETKGVNTTLVREDRGQFSWTLGA